MRKLKLQVHISVDGFVAGPNGEMDWIHTGASPQPVIDLANSCDTVLLGRKMAPGFIQYWQGLADNPGDQPQPLAQQLAGMRKIVFSQTLTEMPGRNVEVTTADLAATVNALKKEPGKDILVYGGATLVSYLVDLNLIDEYHLFTKPVALGTGLRIFNNRKRLTLISSVFHDQLVTINTYVPASL